MSEKKILCLFTQLLDEESRGGILLYNKSVWAALKKQNLRLKAVSFIDKYKRSSPGVFMCYGSKIKFILFTVFLAIFFRPDHIFCGHIGFVKICNVLRKYLRIPFSTFTYGIDVFEMTEKQRKLIAKSHQIVTISRYTRSKIRQQISNSHNKEIFLLAPTFDHHSYIPLEKDKIKIPKLLEAKLKGRTLLTICRLSKTEGYKGYDKVIQAVAELRTEIPDIVYLIGGKGDDMPRIESLIREYKLEGKVFMVGYIPDEEMLHYYNLCDCFIMPSRAEGFGIVFLEAIACNKPVIAGNADGSTDAVLDGRLGELVDPDSVDQIVEKIRKVFIDISSEDFLESAAEKRAEAVEAYGDEQFCNTVDDLIKILDVPVYVEDQ